MIPSCEELNVIKSLHRTVFVMMYTKYRVLERNLCEIVSHFHVYRSVVTSGCVFSAVLSNLCQKRTTMVDFC